jgi:hypothetical protein
MVCIILEQSCSKYGLLDHCRGGLEKWLSLSSLEGSNLVRISKPLWPGGWSDLRRLCCSFSWGQFSPSPIVKINHPSSSWIPRWLLGEWLRVKRGTKWKQRDIFFSCLSYLLTQVRNQCFLAKADFKYVLTVVLSSRKLTYLLVILLFLYNMYIWWLLNYLCTFCDYLFWWIKMHQQTTKSYSIMHTEIPCFTECFRN